MMNKPWPPIDLDTDGGPPPEAEPAFQIIVDAYISNIHPPTPVEIDALREWYEAVEPEVVMYAIREAAMNGARSARYIDRIIMNLQDRQITTAAGLEAYKRDRADAMKRKTQADRFAQARREEERLAAEEDARIAAEEAAERAELAEHRRSGLLL